MPRNWMAGSSRTLQAGGLALYSFNADERRTGLRVARDTMAWWGGIARSSVGVGTQVEY